MIMPQSIFSNDHFNSHAHVERDRLAKNEVYLFHYFNSHAHVERDAKGPLTGKKLEISTHTLTWSVTLYMRGDNVYSTFQLTRSRGA